jgi:hypothetical protein
VRDLSEDLDFGDDVLLLILINHARLGHDFHDAMTPCRAVITELNMREGADANRADLIELREFHESDVVMVSIFLGEHRLNRTDILAKKAEKPNMALVLSVEC